jgi:hypothetical protein
VNSPTLFDFPETIRKPNWDEMITTVSSDEKQIIRWIMQLHNKDQAFECDPTYSIGRFWTGLPKPKYRFDINPQIDGVTQADARCLPVASGVLKSLMFDPPFVIGPSSKPGKIRDRFGEYKNVKELWEFYAAALMEFYRVLAPAGLLVFKCQDLVSAGKQHFSHVEIINTAERLGFYSKDLFILTRDNVMYSPNMENQQHARKTHSYFLVFLKRQP